MTQSSLPVASIENEFLRVDYFTTTGPRIIGLHVKGVEDNLLAETPDVHWATPRGEYYLLGGHRLWAAPENPFYICPEGKIQVITEENKVSLRSDVDASGLEMEISFYLDANCVFLTHKVTWHGKESIELAPWGITQLRLGGIAILPQAETNSWQPNRNIVFWPYSQIHDKRLELSDDLILIHGRPSAQPFKLGNFNSHGWIAYLLDRTLFVKRFAVEQNRRYPDLGSNIEVYVRDVCLELESLGPLTTVQPGESAIRAEIWEVMTGEYLATPENALIISKQLSLK